MPETNQLNFRGILPVQPLENINTHPGPWETSVAGETRTQIIKDARVSGTELSFFTVTSGKKLYITSCSLSHSHTAASLAYIRIRDASDVQVTRLLTAELAGSGSLMSAVTFPMPISVDASFDITVFVDNGIANATFQGWEQ